VHGEQVRDATPLDTTRVLTKAFLEVVKALAVKDPATKSAAAETVE
jgi:hypothetical protein